MKICFSLLFTIAFLKSSICFSQEKPVPIFKPDKSKSGDLSKYIEASFRNDSTYIKYFSNACGDYYHEVKFNITNNGSVINLDFDNPTSYMTLFIKDILSSTNKRWLLADTTKSESKTVILPIYFYFTDNCYDTIPKSIKYYSGYPTTPTTPIYNYGLTYQYETSKTIFLWPIKLLGPFIHRIYPYMKPATGKVDD